MEGDNQYFSADFYRDLVYNDQIFDMAKLLDTASALNKTFSLAKQNFQFN
jgi:hypothetical protein